MQSKSIQKEKKLLNLDNYQMETVIIYVAVGALGAVFLPLVLTCLGFRAAGIAAGSIAAKMMSLTMKTAGTIASSSLVAICQSVGVLGVPFVAKAAVSAVFVGVTKLVWD